MLCAYQDVLTTLGLALIGLRRWIVYSRCPATEINCAQFGVKSQFADFPAVYTSSLQYLTHICEDFLLLERESKFIFMLFIRNYTWGYQVISGGVGWKGEILWDDVIARGRWRHRTWYLPFFLCFTHVFLCWSTSLRRSEHAPSADEFSSHRFRSCRTGKVVANYIAVNCSCILPKFRSNMSHISSKITDM